MLHRTTAFVILTVIYALGISAINDMLPNYSWITGTVLAILYFLSLLTIATAPDAWLQEPMKALYEQCDPYPLLREMHSLPMDKLSPLLRQTMVINYCVALHSVGNFQLAYDTLSSLNIDKHAGMVPLNKAVYYNNLCAECRCLNLHEEAEIWYTKMMQIYNDLPDSKPKRSMAPVVLFTRIDHHYYAGEYEKALELLGTVTPQNRIGEVDLHMQLGENYLALGEKELARKNLQLVIEKGNKLYAVTKAKELLAKLDAE
jgi:tetratricopeptide (TPR) repeat protein